MAETRTKFATVEDFIASFPGDVRKGLQAMRRTIRMAAPEAEEVISYGIPAYRLNGMLIFFSAYTGHYSIAVPPASAAFGKFKSRLAGYKVSKSTIQFPFGKPLPLDLIRDIAALRALENTAKGGKGADAKAKPRAAKAKRTAGKPEGTAAKPKTGFASVDDYIASFPKDIAAVLEKIRRTIAKAAPRAEPVISYQMPAYKQGQVLMFFSAWKEHFSLFVPSDATLRFFRKQLAKYEVHKATVKIPLGGPVPYALIAAMTRRRVLEVAGGKGAAGRPIKVAVRKPDAGRNTVRKARA